MTTEYLREHAITPDMVDNYLLGIVPQGEKYAGRLSIPYLTRAGIKAMKFRCQEDHDCKEVECLKTILVGDQRIYNPAAFQLARNVIGLCEGEPDAMVADTTLLPSIGIPGVHAWTAHHAVWKFALRDYDEVLVFAQGDKAGLDFGRMVVDHLGATKAYLVRCDDKADVASMVATGQADRLRERAGL